jgi:hypothetical protein
MTGFTQAPPQSAETIAGFRDGQPWLPFLPTVVREWRGRMPVIGAQHYDVSPWIEGPKPRTDAEAAAYRDQLRALSLDVDGLRSTAGRERTVPVQVPDPVPCPDSRLHNALDNGGTGEHVLCGQCNGIRSVQRPLLVPTWQWKADPAFKFGDGWHVPGSDLACNALYALIGKSEFDYADVHERRLAGVVLHPNPAYLPVVDADTASGEERCVYLYGNGDISLLTTTPITNTDITDQFSTPPPVGALLVDMTGAVWLEGDDVVTEMLCSGCNLDGSIRPDCDGPCKGIGRVPLSASTTGLTVVEVPT